MAHPDVIVTGAGIIGLSIAWRLAPRLRVRVIDAGVPGGEASWAGAGMLVPGSEYPAACPPLQFAMESLNLYPGFVAELEQETGLTIDFTQCGSLELACSAEEMAGLAHRAEAQRRAGMRAEVVDAASLRRRVPQLAGSVVGAVFYPAEGQVDPRTVTAALLAALARRGVEVLPHTPAGSLRWDAAGVVVRTADGRVHQAPRAVIAAGAWSSALDTGARLPECYPVRGHLVGYDLAPGSLAHVLRFHHTYVVQRRSGYTIAGVTQERVGFDRSIDPEAVADVARRAHALVPALLPRQPAGAWTGFRPGSDFDLPHLGQYEDSPVWLAYGHYRNGILLAPATAARVAAGVIASLEKSQAG